MLSSVRSSLLTCADILQNNVVPYFELHKEYSASDLSAITAQFLTLQTSLLTLDNSIKDEYLNFPKNLLLEYVVSQNCTSVDFTDLLDLNTHKRYRIEIDIVNSTASAMSLRVFINGDTVLTNYYNQWGSFANTSVAGSRVNSANILSFDANSVCTGNYVLSMTDGYASIVGSFLKGVGSAVQLLPSSTSKTAKVSNVTGLTFTSNVSNSIGIGSKFRIYRGDV